MLTPMPAVLLLLSLVTFAFPPTESPTFLDRVIDAVREETMHPYRGPSAQEHVDRITLHGKIMAGYQGWFNAPEDESKRGWVHWSKDGPMEDGHAAVDLWPDMTEYGGRYPTGFKHKDGSVAKVFSSLDKETVLLHFEWMQTYGIDGVFVQRFLPPNLDLKYWRSTNTILAHCREGANRSGRTYAVMYDLSGLGAGETTRVKDDWNALRRQMRITDDKAYLHHNGKPLVVVWGIGFADGRRYTLDECLDLVKHLQADGCTVMIGVPTFWREGGQDALREPLLKEIVETADLVSPWTVGRYDSPAMAESYASEVLKPDLDWARQRGTELMPVVFPGFSWHNLHGGPLNQIPRQKGQFFWTQLMAAKDAGAEMIYVAMFDEVDEATAIFKCTNDPPVAQTNQFLTYEGLPSDYYLQLTGQAGEVLRGERQPTEAPPQPRLGGRIAEPHH